MKLEDLKDEEGHMILNKKQRETLEENGIPTVEVLATTPLKTITGLSGFGEKSARDSWQSAMNVLLGESFMPADEFRDKFQSRTEFLTTGSKQIDSLLGGGVATGEIFEVAGEEGVGKTQFCLQLCATVQLPKEKGGLDGTVIYFDTENNFKVNRVQQIADGLGLKDWEKRITIAECYTSDHQKLLLDNVAKKIDEEHTRLLIVDSMIIHFRSEYIGRDQLSPRQQLLNQYIAKLRHYARTYNLAVVYTNQAISNPSIFGPHAQPTGGHILGHGCSARLWIRQSKGSTRIIGLKKSAWLPEGETVFKITEKGLEDVEG